MDNNNPISLEFPEDIDSNIGILQKVVGNIDGRAFWAFMVMKPSTYQEISLKIANNEDVNLMDYGNVVKKGWGIEPPEEISLQMVEEYGFDENFEKDLQQIIELEQAKEK